MERVRSKASRPAALVVALATVCAALVVPAVQSAPAGAASATIERPEGAGPPVAASGVGTQAALDNPKCRHDDPKYGAYGRFDTAVVGGGPVCVKAWKAGADNGGATAQGVTKDRITVVAVVPNETQLQTDPVKPQPHGGPVAEHVHRRDPRLPAAADEVLRDVGPRHRGQVHDVVGQ